MIAQALSLLFCLTLLFSVPGMARAEKTYGEANRFNVVLVVDKSGSLCCENGTGTDPEGLRFDALRMFLGLLTESGNNVGAVVFDEHIRYEAPIKPIDGMEDKKALIRQLEKYYPCYDTDIGTAMLRATEMLKDMKRKNDLPCMILLFSDGKTDFTTGDVSGRLHASWANADKALKAAKEEGITINGILLNVGGAADRGIEEFRLYTYGTGGQFEEVKWAPDLSPAFRRLYQIVTNAAYTGDQRISFNEQGDAELYFTVPSFGVEEVNVIIEGEDLRPKDDRHGEDEIRVAAEIRRPDGTVYDLDGHDLENARYLFYKIPSPDLGIWHVLLRGRPDDWVDVTMVGNPSLSVVLGRAEPTETYIAHTPYAFTAEITDAAVPKLTEEQLGTLKAVLVREDPSTGMVREYPASSLKDSTFLFEGVSFPKDGEYALTAEISLGDFRVPSAALNLLVDSAPLVPKVSTVTDMLQYGRFRDGFWELDLDELFGEDRESGLIYTLSDDHDGLLHVENGVLRVALQNADPLSFTVTATDLTQQSATIPFDIAAPSVKADTTHVSNILALGRCSDLLWELDLDELFDDPKGGALSYTLSGGHGSAVTIEDGVLRAQLNEDGTPLSFTVTATDMTQQSAKVAFDAAVPTVTAKIDRVTNIMKMGKLRDRQWEMELANLFYDPSGAELHYALSDDCGGAVTIEDDAVHVDFRELREADFELTASNALGRKASIPFSLKVPGPAPSVGGITETIKTGLFQEGSWERKLNTLFSEPKGTAMSFALSDDFDGAATIRDGAVHVDMKGLKKAEFQVIATDEYGIRAELPVTLTEKNMTPLYLLIALGALLGLGGIVFGIVYWRRYYW